MKEKIDTERISVYDMAISVDQFYHKLSAKLAHLDIPTPKTDTEWKEVYELVGARYVFQRKSI